jgi:hypothetical protein
MVNTGYSLQLLQGSLCFDTACYVFHACCTINTESGLKVFPFCTYWVLGPTGTSCVFNAYILIAYFILHFRVLSQVLTTQIIFLYSTNRFVFVIDTNCLVCEVELHLYIGRNFRDTHIIFITFKPTFFKPELQNT